MRLKLVLLLLVSNCLVLLAQTNNNSGVINGKVIDKNTQQPIPYVNISVMETAKSSPAVLRKKTETSISKDWL